jgi:FixJ family two-component response regulator
MPEQRDVVAVVDDNLSILGAMSRLLSAFGYDTELYISAKEFLEVGNSTEAICLIVDIHLGESCGIDFARHLTSQGLTIPMIFMTADASESLKKRAQESGCAAFLLKPFSALELIETIRNLPARTALRNLRSTS